MISVFVQQVIIGSGSSWFQHRLFISFYAYPNLLCAVG